MTSFSRAAAGRLLELPDGTRPEPIVCPGHPAEDLPPPIRAPLERPCRRVCFNRRVIVDGSYWVGRRAHHFDQRCC